MTQNERISLPLWKKIILLILTIFIFWIQISLFVLMFQINFYNGLNTFVYVLIEVFSLLIAIHIVHKPILTSYKLTWAILILILPLPFAFLYYLNQRGRRLPRRKQIQIDSLMKKNKVDNNLIKQLEKVDSKGAKYAKIINFGTGSNLYNNTKYTFLNDGYVKFLDLIEELKKAESYIFIESFIIAEGYLLNTLLPILEEKGKSGVEIKIIYDDLGSKATLKPTTIKKITNIPNCQITNYNPLGLNINPAFNYRNHRKIIIIDGKTAYCGGDNLADEYIHKKERFGFWRDNCGKFEGDAVVSFLALFIETWFMSTKEILDLKNYIKENSIINEHSYVMPFGDGPSDSNDTGYEIFKTMVTSAEKTLYISTPYLVIDDAMIQAIVLAAKSGVDVRILMPGIPDKKSAFYLARYYYRDILKAGGKIYEFSKGFNHAKNIIIDNKYAFIGTINMDYRSMFLHYECGAIVMLDEQIKLMQKDFLKACSESEQVEYDKWKKRPWYQKLIAYILYLFAPMF